MKPIKDYIPEFKKYICDNCLDCACTRSCVIWADAMKASENDKKEEDYTNDKE